MAKTKKIKIPREPIDREPIDPTDGAVNPEEPEKKEMARGTIGRFETEVVPPGGVAPNTEADPDADETEIASSAETDPPAADAKTQPQPPEQPIPGGHQGDPDKPRRYFAHPQAGPLQYGHHVWIEGQEMHIDPDPEKRVIPDDYFEGLLRQGLIISEHMFKLHFGAHWNRTHPKEKVPTGEIEGMPDEIGDDERVGTVGAVPK